MTFKGIEVRPLLKLSRVEELIRKNYVFGGDVPARSTLIEWCESGTFATKRINGIYFVYEDSLMNWLTNLQRADAA